MSDETIPHDQALTSRANGILNHLFCRLSADLPIVLRDPDNKPMLVRSADDLAQALAHDPEPYVDMVVGGLVAFVAQHAEGVGEDAWKDLSVKPSVVIARDVEGVRHEMRYFIFAIPQRRVEVEALAKGMGVDLTEAVPLDGSNGWSTVHTGEAVHTPSGLSILRTDGGGLGRFRDAVIRTPIDINDPRLDEMVWQSRAGKAISKEWAPKELSRRAALERFCRHRVAKEKDGPCVVLGKLPEGPRKKDLMEAMYFVGLDFDTHIDGDELSARIAEAGMLGVMASTFNHMTTQTTETWKSFANWMIQIGLAETLADAEVTLEVVRARMGSAPKNISPEIIRTMSMEIIGEGDEREVVITHAPMQKWRAIFVLDRPFVIAENKIGDVRGADVWERVLRAMAMRLGGANLDPACLDVSRAWYLPSHPAEQPDYRIDLFGGELVSLDELLAEGTALAENPRPSTLPIIPGVDPDGKVGQALAAYGDGSAYRRAAEITGPFTKRWAMREAHGFDIARLLETKLPKGDTRLRGWHGKKLTIRCPFADDHSKKDTTDSKGAFCCDAGEGLGDGFVIHCNHGSCKSMGRDRLTYLNKMIADQWFTVDDVAAFQTVLHDEEIDGAGVDEADYAGAVSEWAGTGPAKPVKIASPRMAGGVAINGVLDGLEAFNPKKKYFSGPKAADDAIDALSNVASVVKMGNKMRIVIRGKDGLGFSTESEAKLYFAPYRAELEVGATKDGPKFKEVPALDLLLKSDRRKTWQGIDCDPSNALPDHVLNTWEGIEIAPAPGDCSLLKAHILNSMCAGNAEHAHYLTQWFAHMFQKPKEKPGVAPVVIGPKGCGKSTVADILRLAIGRKHSVKIAQAKHLTGNFNAHLGGMLLVQAEEVTFGGDKKGEGPLKDAITAKTMLTERKGLDAYQETNFARFFLVSNPGHAVPASDGERRWLVLHARDLFAGKPMNDPSRTAYFDALYKEAAEGGVAAFLDYLLTYPLEGFTPFAAPDTHALADQVRQSLSDEDQWMMGVLETGLFDTRDGEITSDDWEMDEPLVVECSAVQASFNSHVRRFGGSSGGAGAVRKVLESHGVVERCQKRGQLGRTWNYVLGGRREWRERFSGRFGISFDDEA